MPNFGEKVRSLRKQKGWTLDEMAKQTGLSAPYISQVERNDAGYSTGVAERIAEALDVDAVLLQHPEVDVEKLSDISLILQGLVGLPKEKLSAMTGGQMASTNANELSSKIKLLREERGWSQRELAKRLKMDPAALNRIENGSGNVRVQTIQRFAEAFQVEPSTLLQESVPVSSDVRSSTEKRALTSEEITERLDFFLGERVRTLRKFRGLTLKELSEKLAISSVDLGEMEKGALPWTVSILSAVAKVLGVPGSLLQAPTVPAERLQRLASIFDDLADLPEEQLAAIEQILKALNP